MIPLSVLLTTLGTLGGLFIFLISYLVWNAKQKATSDLLTKQVREEMNRAKIAKDVRANADKLPDSDRMYRD